MKAIEIGQVLDQWLEIKCSRVKSIFHKAGHLGTCKNIQNTKKISQLWISDWMLHMASWKAKASKLLFLRSSKIDTDYCTSIAELLASILSSFYCKLLARLVYKLQSRAENTSNLHRVSFCKNPSPNLQVKVKIWKSFGCVYRIILQLFSTIMYYTSNLT